MINTKEEKIGTTRTPDFPPPASKALMPGRTSESVLSALSQGMQVIARDTKGTAWKGSIDETAQGQGILWIQTDQGERKMIDIFEYVIAPVNSRVA